MRHVFEYFLHAKEKKLSLSSHGYMQIYIYMNYYNYAQIVCTYINKNKNCASPETYMIFTSYIFIKLDQVFNHISTTPNRSPLFL